MRYSDWVDLFNRVFSDCAQGDFVPYQNAPWFKVGSFKVEERDIGKTVVYCPVCAYKIVAGSGAVGVKCPNGKCYGILQFIDVTEDFFKDE